MVQVELAEKTAVLFTKDGDQHNNLFDMQCMWLVVLFTLCLSGTKAIWAPLKYVCYSVCMLFFLLVCSPCLYVIFSVDWNKRLQIRSVMRVHKNKLQNTMMIRILRVPKVWTVKTPCSSFCSVWNVLNFGVGHEFYGGEMCGWKTKAKQ